MAQPNPQMSDAKNKSVQTNIPLKTKQPRPPTRRDQLIKLLSTKSGVDNAAICSKFGWQPHTTRAALSGLQKLGFKLTRSASSSARPAKYRITSGPSKTAPAAKANAN